jgi:dCMP deaminase
MDNHARFVKSTSQSAQSSKASKYLKIALAIAQLSKDESTQVGALLLGANGEGGPWGYNGAPRGCSADEDERKERPEKYFWFEHAERNALYAAARTGFQTIGATIVVTHFPCMDCARAIVQAGIKRVIAPRPTSEFLERWKEHISRALRLFDECGVFVDFISNEV